MPNIFEWSRSEKKESWRLARHLTRELSSSGGDKNNPSNWNFGQQNHTARWSYNLVLCCSVLVWEWNKIWIHYGALVIKISHSNYLSLISGITLYAKNTTNNAPKSVWKAGNCRRKGESSRALMSFHASLVPLLSQLSLSLRVRLTEGGAPFVIKWCLKTVSGLVMN